MSFHRRQPNDHDLGVAGQALSAFGAEYALMGGTAMAVHGFSRATKDIDLLLPVDAHNNAQLIAAMSSIAGNAKALEL